MFPANQYAIRTAQPSDDEHLLRLAVLANQREAIARPALIGEIDGIPVAAISIEDGRVAADPFASPPQLATHLRMRASGIRAHADTPAVADRIRDTMRALLAEAA